MTAATVSLTDLAREPRRVARYRVAMQRWADAVDALHQAAAAADALADALDDLMPNEAARCDGESVGQDAIGIAWAIRLNLSILDGAAPAEVFDLRRTARTNPNR